ncbi:Immunoglobulin V-set domain [Nesidiocoris tenuis]|uniref:Immunoglobulin V-set domain n=1 Tax=Nesidiocoris tenuis TaxID=355587 RepID=A0ABN7A7Q0_9HEMI|nr:Immunoglobulin V-set domain [Nesidiocoris tenuis]
MVFLGIEQCISTGSEAHGRQDRTAFHTLGSPGQLGEKGEYPAQERKGYGQHPKGENGDPEFAFPIGNLTTPLGREAVLSCTVNDLGKYKVGWLRAGDQTVLSLHTRVVTHNSRVHVTHEGKRTWRLHIRQIKPSDGGCYMCQINTNVMKKQVGCIDVHVPPDISNNETSADVSIQEGENATLVCKATGHPKPRIMWKREDGTPILIKKPRGDISNYEIFNGSSLHFWRLDRRQMGAFLCIATNDVPPTVSKRIILNVNFAPSIRVPNQLFGAPLATDVNLVCLVEAFPNTINYWVKNGGEMLLDGSKYQVRENRVGYKVLMTLKIRSFVLTDVGTYNCVSTNSLGRAEGTLRLYDIKLHPNDSADDQAAFLGELAESSRGEKSRSELKKDSGCPQINLSLRLFFVVMLRWIYS